VIEAVPTRIPESRRIAERPVEALRPRA
jgi:hypothetical protein